MKNKLRYYITTFLLIGLLAATALPYYTLGNEINNFSKIPEENFTANLSFIVLLLLNLVFLIGYKTLPTKKLSLKQLIIPVIVFNIIAIFILPLTSNDLYTHFYRTRILIKYNANPYFDPYSKYPFDFYYPILNNVWSKHTAIYGPFFWIVLSGIVSLAKANFLSVYLIKLFYSILFFVSGYVVYKTTKSKKALYLFLWNPYLIFFGVLDGHSDILLLSLLLLSVFFANKVVEAKSNQKLIFTAISWALFVLSFLIKIYVLPASIIVFYLLTKNLKLKSFKEILVLGTQLFVLGAFIIVICYLPFWKGVGTLGRYREIFRGYESGKYFLGAFPVVSGTLLSKLCDLFQLILRLSFVVFYFLFGIKLLKNIFLKVKFKESVYTFWALSILFFVGAFIRVWNPWYFTIPVGFLTINYSKNSKYIFILSALGALYSILL